VTTGSGLIKLAVEVDSALGAVTWRASSDQPWLKFAAQIASTPSELVVTLDPSGLSLGTHEAVLTISGEGVANSPLVIPVELRVVDHLHTTYLPQIVR